MIGVDVCVLSILQQQIDHSIIATQLAEGCLFFTMSTTTRHLVNNLREIYGLKKSDSPSWRGGPESVAQYVARTRCFTRTPDDNFTEGGFLNPEWAAHRVNKIRALARFYSRGGNKVGLNA